MMQITHASCLSRAGAGAVTNEDHASHGRNWLIVLDGSSGLTGSRHTNGVTDAAWFVEAVASRLGTRLAAPRLQPLPEVLSSVLADVQSEYQAQTAGGRVERIDQPSASAAVVRLFEDKLEYFVIGDCLLGFREGGEFRLVEDSRVAAFDEVALERLKAGLLAGQDARTARREIQPVLVENRMRKNRGDGYWVLAPDLSCVAHGLSAVVSLRAPAEIVALTDGFTALADQFRCFASRKALCEFILHNGVEAAERMLLRETEADPDCVRHPRFKLRDDFSCVAGRIAPLGSY